LLGQAAGNKVPLWPKYNCTDTL
jgi:hypothetical protein